MNSSQGFLKQKYTFPTCCRFSVNGNEITHSNISCIPIYGVSQEECARLQEGVPYVKLYRYNPKHLCPMAREKCGLLAGPHTVPVSWQSYPFLTLSVVSYDGNSTHASHSHATLGILMYSVWNPKDNYDMSASVFVVQFNGFMSLTS